MAVEMIGAEKFKEIAELMAMKYLLEFKGIIVDEIWKRYVEMGSEENGS